MRASVFIAISLDGFIARKDGSVDWLMAASTPDDTEDYGFKAFFDSVDCMVMGRNSMEMVLSFNEWPYAEKRVVVLSNTLTEAPDKLSGKIELYAGSLRNWSQNWNARAVKGFTSMVEKRFNRLSESP